MEEPEETFTFTLTRAQHAVVMDTLECGLQPLLNDRYFARAMYDSDPRPTAEEAAVRDAAEARVLAVQRVIQALRWPTAK